MSTRTTGKRETLGQRVRKRNGAYAVISDTIYDIRAELDRLARMARKGIASGKIVSPAQVIDLINAAKR